MTEEEKKAIKIVKGLAVYYDDYCLLDEEENESVNKSIELILNLIEKLSKENEQLKELKEIEESHRKENGELREKVKQLEEENKTLKESKPYFFENAKKNWNY